ncbi:MAG TPA: CGNR zinc finger domain-containing protein [Terriglobales bacterium]|nr:CGNR zinc finger domain-containing protein [Terriglobales bacterium]
MSQPSSKSHFDLSGGNLALDFVNTVSNRPAAEPIERLTDYNHLVFFGLESNLYPHAMVNDLYIRAGRLPGMAKNALLKAIQFREALFAIFSAVVEHRAIPGNALQQLTLILQEGMANGRLVHNGHLFAWEWTSMNIHLESALWPVARAAADLLLSDELENVRMCASDECAWLFIDRTKNHRRRWCDMKTCGNRVKARRHYQRMNSK